MKPQLFAVKWEALPVPVMQAVTYRRALWWPQVALTLGKRRAPQTYALPWLRLSVFWMSCEISCVRFLLIIKSDTDGDACNVFLKSQHVTENEVIVLGGGTCSFRCLFNIQRSCSVRAGMCFQMLLHGCASLHIFSCFSFSGPDRWWCLD